MVLLEAIWRALFLAFSMFWELLWPLALGFLLSAVIQTLVSPKAVASALGHDPPPRLALPHGVGAPAPPCSKPTRWMRI